MAFRPGIIPTAFMIFGVLTTAGLGVWQLNRHAEKQALRDEILVGLQGQVLLNADIESSVDTQMFRKVEVTGRFVEPLALTNGRKEFGFIGYGVVQPLLLDDGRYLLVDRGWVPRDGIERAIDEIDTHGETITLQGQLRRVEGGDNDSPAPGRANLPELWPQGSWPALWNRMPEPKIDAIVLAGQPILAGEGKSREPLPVDGYKPFPKTTNSLSYTFQWWIFGTVLFIVWIALGISRGRATPEIQAST